MSADFAALIEPQRLREAIAALRAGMHLLAAERDSVCRAAEAHLATLPEPPRLMWRVYVNDGPASADRSFNSEEDAIEFARGFLSIPEARVEVIVRQVKP